MGKIAFIFPGQGAQYKGMGSDILMYKGANDVFEKASDILHFDMKNLCFDESEDKLTDTENAQPAILTVSIALMKILEGNGIHADMTGGLSLGEYSALVCSGAFSFEDTVDLVRKRGRFMKDAIPKGEGGMSAVIGLDSQAIEKICNEVSLNNFVCIANYNCPGQTIISGTLMGINEASILLKQEGAKKVIPLSVSGPFHTPMLKSASEKLYEELLKMHINDMNIPVITNLTGEFIEDCNSIYDTLKLQIMSPVKWEKCIRTMISNGADTFIEIGPSKTLTTLVKKINKDVRTINIENGETLEKYIGGTIC